MFRYFLCLIGVAIAIPILGVIALAFILPITISGIGYLLGSLLAATGLILAPRISKYYVVVIVGIFVVMVVAGTRLFLIRWNADPNLQVVSLPQAKATAWINTLIDEQDTIIFGEALFHQIGGDSINEHVGLTSALATDYADMRKEGMVASPVISTYLNLQQPNHFDVVVIKPTTHEQPTFALIFLHGYMGNVTAQCWEIAQAVQKLGGLTVCPSTELTGQWWLPNGQVILKSTFEYVREQGIQKIYLGGFSNGGFSIGYLAPQLKNEAGLSGLILIDGIYDGISLKETGLPILVIGGQQDERVPSEFVRPIAEQIGESVTYMELEGDHFLIMKHPTVVQSAISSWLKRWEGR